MVGSCASQLGRVLSYSSIYKYSATAWILGKGWSWQEAARALCQALGRCGLQGAELVSLSSISVSESGIEGCQMVPLRVL